MKKMIAFFCMLVCGLSMADQALKFHSVGQLAFGGATSEVAGQCVAISLQRTGTPLNFQSNIQLNGVNQYIGLFTTSDCKTSPLTNLMLYFAPGQSSITLYATSQVAQPGNEFLEVITATDSSSQFAPAQLDFTIQGPALKFSGTNSGVVGQCVPITLNRVGPNINGPTSVTLSGWDSGLTLYPTNTCSGATVPVNSSVTLVPGQGSLTLYALGAYPGPQGPNYEGIIAVDPSGSFSPTLLNYSVLPPALSFGGASSEIMGQCVAISLNRVGPSLGGSTTVSLSGWNPNLTLFQGSNCQGVVINPGNSVSFAPGQGTLTLYATGYIPGPSPISENLQAVDLSGQFTSAQWVFTINPPALSFGGASSEVMGQCVAISLNRVGPNLNAPTTVNLSGWDPNLTLFQGSNCQGAIVSAGSSLGFAPGQGTLTLYATGYVPGSSPISEQIQAVDPTGQFSSAQWAFTVKPPALFFGGANSETRGQCVAISINRVGPNLNGPTTVNLSGWDSNLTLYQSSNCQGTAITLNGSLVFSPGESSITFYAQGNDPGPGSWVETIQAVDISGQFSTAQLPFKLN